MDFNFKKTFSAFAIIPFLLAFFQGLIYGSFDYGDAPDGVEAYQGVMGKFPSERLSGGARVKVVKEVWLGEGADREVESRQINLDQNDDGVALSKISACAKSSAQFFVHIKDIKNIRKLGQGKAYLNLFIDWNKDGEWRGRDSCAEEWAVKNFEIDLSKQTQAIAVYAPEFMAGKDVENFWYRGAITLDEKFTNETGSGSFRSGEIEDYGPIFKEEVPPNKPRYSSFCSPKPLVVEHGRSANFIVIPALDSEPIESVEFNKVAKPNPDREIKEVKASPAPFTFAYISNKKDGPDRVESDLVSFFVAHLDNQGNRVSYILNCPVLVKHKEERVIIEEPPKKVIPPTKPEFIETKSPANPASGVGDKNPAPKPKAVLGKFPSFDSFYRVVETGGITSFIIAITPQDLAGQTIGGLGVELSSRNYSLPSPVNFSINLNDAGINNDWQCISENSFVNCRGVSSLKVGVTSSIVLEFDQKLSAPLGLNVSLIDNQGEKIGSVGVEKSL